jgi:endonuclease G, mitochondrial
MQGDPSRGDLEDAGAHDAAPGDARTSDASARLGVHVAMGIPADLDGSDDVLLAHQTFVLSYNPRLKDPNWVSWRLQRADMGGTPRQDSFRADPLLPSVYPRALPADYRGSGYDRGHMCPSADRTATIEMNDETFVMTNMQPQLHALNAGPWEQLEAHARQIASDGGRDVYTIAGGLFDPVPPTIGSGVAVPRASFKILVIVDAGRGVEAVTSTTTTFAVIMPNAASVAGTSWQQYLTTIDDLEAQTGYDFLRAIPEDTQAVLEARR